jgi:hypothetical protein
MIFLHQQQHAAEGGGTASSSNEQQQAKSAHFTRTISNAIRVLETTTKTETKNQPKQSCVDDIRRQSLKGI